MRHAVIYAYIAHREGQAVSLIAQTLRRPAYVVERWIALMQRIVT